MIKDEIIIRCAEKKDVPQIVRLAHLLAKEEGSRSLISAPILEGDAFSDKAKCQFFVAEVTDAVGSANKDVSAVVGMLMYYEGYDLESASSGLHLGDIIVDPAFRRSGVGNKLFQAICSKVLSLGGEWISWTVDANNKSAQKFYKNAGAQQVAVKFMAIGKKTIQHVDKS